ncbi:plasmid replication initiator [Gluconacetobacter diazotrophicus]|uniref:Plasmid replication initiator n=1 Tax=Gluconacetobacter diazotrophicus TaxID=33996 RepID=A0A7W4I7V3_GLUDI|nr:replication protein RepA [Gluconacetobacter diazotrophicus]MBB2157908.1 plasmid replication initiator [Gluconacetobacter diazotrophicus]
MGVVHKLIETNGKQGALALDIDRKIIEIASDYMADEEGGIGFLYSGWAQAALPHKRLADDAVWQIQTDKVTMIVEPGRRAVRDASPIPVGVPFGSKARLIMLYLQTEALKRQNREVELGGSLRAWLKRMGIPQGGKSINDVKEQAERLSRCRLSFHIQHGSSSGLINQNIVDSAMFSEAEEIVPTRKRQLVAQVRLSELFYEQLKKHPVPIEEAAIRALNGHSQALDLYCWLAYRLHALQRQTPITWVALKAQFGPGTGRMDHFKTGFIDNLKLALAVYPEAGVTVGPAGVVLYPSRPPIAPR